VCPRRLFPGGGNPSYAVSSTFSFGVTNVSLGNETTTSGNADGAVEGDEHADLAGLDNKRAGGLIEVRFADPANLRAVDGVIRDVMATGNTAWRRCTR
jgi:hypothetical protein